MASGYPLHLDATSVQGQGGVFLCLDGWRGWVLHAVKVSSENAAELRPAIESTLAAFGQPVAFMRDRAARERRRLRAAATPRSPTWSATTISWRPSARSCWMSNMPRCSASCGAARCAAACANCCANCRANCVRPRKDLPARILWVLEGEGRKHLPYPFALPHWDFYRRCGQFRRQAQRRLPRPRSRIEQRTLRRADAVLAALGRAGRIAWAVPRLERKWSVFNELLDNELPHGN